MRWKPFLFGAVLATMTVGCCYEIKNIHPPAVVSPVERKADYRRSVVKLQVLQRSGKATMVATGFAIDKERIMTAGHFCVNVIEGQVLGLLRKKVQVIILNNNDELAIASRATIDTVNEQMDICVIKVPKHGLVPLEFIEDYESLRVYQKVFITGAPLGVFPVETEGHIIRLRSAGWPVVDLNDRIVVSAPATYGNSGGPIVTEDGKVVGIMMAKSSYDHVIIGVHMETIREYLKQEYGE